MSMSTNPPFLHLRSKLREWQPGSLLRPNDHSLRQFRTVAPVSLLPLVKDLHEALEAEGLRATVREMVQDLGFLSLTIDDFDIEVSFTPCEAPNVFRMSTCRMGNQESSLTRLLAYQDLGADRAGVMGLVEESVLWALDPQRATKPNPVGEPTTTPDS